MSFLFSNNASSRTTVAVLPGDTTVQVMAGEGNKFPLPGAGDYFMVTLEDRRSKQIEICKCTSRAGDSLYVERAQEGTAAQNFAVGATASNRMTAGTVIGVLNYGYSKAEADTQYVNITGDTMTGPLALPADPIVPMQSATKQYVDNRFASIPVFTASRIKSLVYMVAVSTSSINMSVTTDVYGQTYTVVAQDAFDVYINGLREFRNQGTYGGYTIAGSTITFTNAILAGSSVAIDVFRVAAVKPVVSVYKLAAVVPNGVTTVFTMGVQGSTDPVNALSDAEVAIFVNNVPQQPGVDYTALGATLTFSEAPEVDADVWGTWTKTES